MSEFSNSYHLRTKNSDDVVNLLKKANLGGFIFGEKNGWVTFVSEGPEFQPNDELIENNFGTLLHFVSADDHGWGFTVYKGNELVCSYACFWEGDIGVERDHYQEDIVKELIDNDNSKLEEINNILFNLNVETLGELLPADSFAEKIGLTYFKWLSFEYVNGNVSIYKEECPELKEV